ncbi:MAG: DUF6479 family protein [Chloroflexi bacterium]|nr:DUF6479 family protein [Chloroflexota bacterium]
MSGYLFVILAIVFVAVLFGSVFYGARILVRETTDFEREERREPSKAALDMLEQRYAQGELSREEFERMKKDIDAAFDEDSREDNGRDTRK